VVAGSGYSRGAIERRDEHPGHARLSPSAHMHSAGFVAVLFNLDTTSVQMETTPVQLETPPARSSYLVAASCELDPMLSRMLLFVTIACRGQLHDAR
jgi:hypothetical protein